MTNNLDIANAFAEHLQDIHQTQEGPFLDSVFKNQVEQELLQASAVLQTLSIDEFIMETNSNDKASVTPTEIDQTIKLISSKSAPGNDRISNKIIKHSITISRNYNL